MERMLYRQTDEPGWPDLITKKFGSVIHEAYLEQNPNEYVDVYQEAAETIDSDIIFSLEQDGAIVGFTAVKILPEFSLTPAVYVREIAVDSRYRGGGVSHQLRQWMNDELQPQVILGIANNPVSVISRARAFDRLGFQTFWSNVPVIPYSESLPQETVDSVSCEFVQRVFPNRMVQYQSGILPYTENDIWAFPTQGLRSCIGAVLDDILAFQLEYQVPAMAPLISVKL